MSGSLNLHADAVLEELRREDPSLVTWTERIFRCLTAEESGRRIRRPTRLDRIYGIVGAADEAKRANVRSVVERIPATTGRCSCGPGRAGPWTA